MTAKKKNILRLAPAFLFFLLFAVIIKSAWICDDAYISFRYIKNVFGGYGLHWNPGERVQAFTNPLYVLLVTPFFALSKNMYLSAIFLSVAAAMAAAVIGLYPKGRRNLPLLIISVTALAVSKAFIDYSTSGLENPLTFLILALFFNEFLRTDKPWDNNPFFKLVFLSSLIALNRVDTLVFAAPPLVFCFIKRFNFKKILLGLAGLAPLILWELFSFIYFGSFVPNTAIAKLNNTTSFAYVAQNGLRYIFSTNLYGDVVTTFVIFLAVLSSVYSIKKKKYKYLLTASAVFLYMCYIVYIGGDFMVGRHLSAPFFLSVMLLYNIAYDYIAEKKPSGRPVRISAACISAVFLLAGCLSPTSTITSKIKYDQIEFEVAESLKSRPLDERKFYYNDSGLTYYIANSFANGYDPQRSVYMTGHQGRFLSPDKVYVQGVIGFMAFFAPADVKFIDYNALADPLLARIPAAPNQRVGHYGRLIPAGYEQTVLTGVNVIEDPYLKEYYDKLCVITKGRLLSPERIKAIFEMNTGKYDYLMDGYMMSEEYREYLE